MNALFRHRSFSFALRKRGRKFFAGILLGAVLGAWLFSVGFILHAADHDCSISDAMACCQQGIEFAPTNAVVWPQDFPAPGARILVQGVFDTYEEKGQRFVHLRNAVLSFKR